MSLFIGVGAISNAVSTGLQQGGVMTVAEIESLLPGKTSYGCD